MKMPKEIQTFRIDPQIKELVTKRAQDLDCPDTYIIELALVEMFKHELPPGFIPGVRKRNDRPEQS